MANVEADSDRSDDDFMFNNLFENQDKLLFV